ncbi:hypothetical protein RvY_02867-1 [Ramazzottius varieornatus]|uniref:Uncharacterized protein n=1 Tax=Ramazzottius varieornatus TaxID=947166 RepID=A0A1D1UL75_RAMVA|nr:hypothetical protein RvY_02867-1 [Ramazzottius varieornatus]
MEEGLEEAIRAKTISDSNSGSWHQALPSLPLDSLLDSNSSRIGVGLRLGAKLSRAHKCRCGANVDGYGQHGLSCSFSGGRYSRHSALNESLKRALTLAQISAILDPPGIFRKNKRRPDGMTQVPWKNGKELVWDVGVVDTLTNFAMSLWKPDQLLMLPKRERFPSIEISEVSFCSALLVWSPLGHRPCATKLFEAIGRNTMEVTGESRERSQLPAYDIESADEIRLLTAEPSVETERPSTSNVHLRNEKLNFHAPRFYLPFKNSSSKPDQTHNACGQKPGESLFSK